MRSLLVFRTGYFGDAVVALPALQTLRKRHPDAHIAMLTNDDDGQSRVVARDVIPPGVVDEYLTYPLRGAVARLRLALQIRRRHFDRAIYLAPRIRTRTQIERDRKLFRLMGIHEVIGIDVDVEMQPRDRARHLVAVERESDFLLRRIGGTATNEYLSLTERERSEAALWLRNHGLRLDEARTSGPRLVAFAPTSAMPSKQWPVDRFVAVARQVVEHERVHPIIVCSAAEAELGQRLVDEIGVGTATAGSLSIRGLAALLEACDLFIGVDTGSMHLAAAAGVRCVVVMAATDSPGRWTPHGDGHTIFRHAVDCEGCALLVCPEGNLCTRGISENDVLDAALKVLRRGYE